VAVGPTLSVLITYHEEGPLLGECIRSFLEQAAPPDEVLVHDDASRPEAAASAHVPADDRVRVIVAAPPSRGPAYGRNRLLEEARGEYVHFHDADDLALPGWGTLVRGALAARPDAVYTDVASCDEAGQEISPRVLGLEPRHAESAADWVRVCLEGIVLTPAGTHRRRRLLEVGGYDEGLWGREDWDLTLRLALTRGYLPIVIPRPAVRIRLRAASLSHRASLQAEHGLLALRKAGGYLPAEHRPWLADVALRAGLELHAGGQAAAARAYFELARELGPASMDRLGLRRGLLLRLLGPERYAAATKLYRSTVPGALRRRLGRRQ